MGEYLIVNLFWSFCTAVLLITAILNTRDYRREKREEEARHERLHQRAIDWKTKRPDIDYICLVCSEPVEPRDAED